MDELVAMSHRIHGYSEVAFEEERSSEDVAGVLSRGGYDVDFGRGLPTAFVARAGTGGLTIALCAEYDALPGLGHACGHNIIAASAVGGALALLPLVDDLDITLEVIGTPAEESGGGKIALLEAGVFDDVHAALMVHPTQVDLPIMPCIAVEQIEVTYTGRTANAHRDPGDGINAANAMVLAQVALGMLRQELGATGGLHGFVSEAGTSQHTIADVVRGTFFLREHSVAALDKLRERITECFEAGARATRADVSVLQKGPAYSEFVPDPDLVRLYAKQARSLGRTFVEIPRTFGWSDLLRTTGATDMANVSMKIPAIHPLIGMETGGVGTHHPDFGAAALGTAADPVIHDGSAALAGVVIDAASDPDIRSRLLARTPPKEDPQTFLAAVLAGEL